MTLNEYQAISWNSYFGKNMPKHEQLTNHVLKLCGEVGEISDQLGKEFYLGITPTNGEVIEELGDALWHLACLAMARGFTLEDIARHNIEKLRSRYPDAYWSGVEEILNGG